MTVSEVRGCGREQGPVDTYRGIAHQVGYVSKIKIEVVLSDEELDGAVEAVLKAANTGRMGDGKIFIIDLCEVVSIRTGESHLAAVG
jgi:nitrogen regulatory protein PII